MGSYKIHQLVYTKLNPEDSPFDKKDFHTAFYPLKFLTATDVLVLENHIYIPGNDDFLSKQVVYFNKIKEETYLFVFNINILANEVDMLGRGGVFLCHVFMFPQDLWQQLPSPNQLMELVKKYKYNSRSKLLNSSYIDKQSGNMLPIQLDSEIVEKAEKKLPKIEGSFEGQMLLHLTDSFNQENAEQKFIVHAKETEARELFNKLICYLPNEQKVKVGWDTMYDGGRMMDYNKTFVAYKNNAPRGGSASTLVKLSKKLIELAQDFKVNKEQSPFTKWATGCSGSIETHFYIEEAHNLSKSMLAKTTYNLTDNWNIECFAKVNIDLVEKLFTKKCKEEFKRKLFKELNKIMSIKDKLLFIHDKLEFSTVADYLLIIIDNSKIAAKFLDAGISKEIINNSPTLILIEQLCNTDKFDLEAFNQLTDNQKLQLNKYVLKTSFQKKDWYLELIKSDEALLNYYIRKYPKPKRIIRRFRKVLKMNETEIYQMGFSLLIIRRIFYFKMAHFFNKISSIFRRRKKTIA
ncbi:MAG: hypothetical protein ABFS35_00295 [Bacteroidota bacterium]